MEGRVDGIWYKDMSDAPDLGSIRCVRNTGMIRHYYGLSADVAKLPDYVDTGSTCFFADTGELYVYEKMSNTWYKQ